MPQNPSPTGKTLQEKYEELVAAIQKAVPELRMSDEEARTWIDIHGKPVPPSRDIILEDVLRALQAKFKVNGWMNPKDEEEKSISLAAYDGAVLQICGNWKMGHSLEWHLEHSPETILFLHSIICV
jgi:hypothetical protein